MSKKLLKRLTAAALGVLMTAAAVISAFAAQETTYTIDEIDGMQLKVVSDMMAVTRKTDSSDGYFSLPNNGYGEVMKKMEDGNIYLLATDSQQSITVAVSMFENDDTRKIDNYSNLSGDELNKIVLGYKENSDGTTYSASTVDEVVDDIIWIDFEFRATVDNSVYKQYQANTVVNGKNVSVTIQRNGSDVIGSDYDVLKTIVSSVKFTKTGLPKNFMLYIIIGAAVLVIIVLIIIIIAVKRAGKRRKKNKNDKIIEELASKYNSGRSSSRESSKPVKLEPEINTYSEPSSGGSDGNIAKTMHFDMHKARTQSNEKPAQRYYDDDDGYPRPVKSYTDEEIARLLGDTEDDENFTDTLSATEADFGDIPGEESVVNSPETAFEAGEEPVQADEFEENGAEEKTLEQELAEIEAEKPLKSVREVFDFSKFMQNARKKAEAEYGNEAELAAGPEKPKEDKTESEDNQTADEQPEQLEQPGDPSAETAENSAEEPVPDEAEELTREEVIQQELDEYNNDEVLVREEAKRNKFNSSVDFFEEAPKKIMGVISREEIEDAEEFDVITEVEKKATEVEKEPVRREVKKQSMLKKTANGFKSFGKHCGYFAKNVKREIKHSKAKKKHKQEEEERRARAKQRAERQKIQAKNGGLVQVKARGQRKPGSNRRG